MENSFKLANWAITHSSQLNVKVTSMDWPKRLNLEVYDFEVSLCFNEKEYIGRGTDINSNVALTKAIGESIERFIIFENGLETSNGVAIHTLSEAAISNSKIELYERSSFLSHYLTSSTFFHFPEEQIETDIYFKAKNFLNNLGIDLNLSLMKGFPGVYFTVCYAIGKNYRNPFGVVIGLGSAFKLQDSILKSIFECLRTTMSIALTPHFNSITLEEFNRIEIYHPKDHQQLALNTQYFDSISDIFNFKMNYENLEKITDSELYTIRVNELKIPQIFGLDSLIFAFHSESSTFQNHYLGKTTEKKVNLIHLSKFSENKIAMENINKIPHPFG